MFSRLFALLSLLTLLSLPLPAQAHGPLVLAAASMQEALNEAADDYARRGHERPVLSFAASSALARQIESGAPADLFISADEDWMDAMAAKGLIVANTRATLVTNRLVLIAKQKPRFILSIGRKFPLAKLLGEDGRLAIAEPNAVPAGRYARAALMSLGLWDSVADRLAQGDSVRAALALVERDQAPFGIVYATDAAASGEVRVVGLFPPSSHPPITYPIARLNASRDPAADVFRRYLLGPDARRIFRRHKFLVP